jgi:molybdenum cofactor guanylyltransferase
MVVGIVLAGGRARRMSGADKPMLTLAGKTLMQHVIGRAAPQVDELLINANGDTGRFAGFGRTLVPDSVGDYPGPLAGILAGFEWTKQNRPTAQWLVSFACDCPFLPEDLVDRLVAAAKNSNVPVSIAASGSRHHPVFATWRTDLPLSTDEVLRKRALRKVDGLVECFPNVRVEFDARPIDPFFNINTPADLAFAESLMRDGMPSDA